MSELDVKKMIMEAERLAEEEAKEQIRREEAERMRKMSDKTEALYKKEISKTSYGW